MHTPPIVALLLTVVLVVYLFRRDFREQPNVTRALWLPLCWMLLIGSRFVSEWLNSLGVSIGGISLEEGSPIDAAVFFVLIVSAARVLIQRQLSLAQVVHNNRWLTVFFVYGFLAILWSDFPFVAFKRWIKVLGHPMMVLILFTEPDPKEAVVRLLKRAAYVLIPFSVLFVKYYPELGRGYDEWSGIPLVKGITTDKNALGHICWVLGVFFFWNLLNTLKRERSVARKKELYLNIGFLLAIGWLLRLAHSTTSLVSAVFGMFLLLVLGSRALNRNFVGTYIILAASVLVIGELTVGLSGQVIRLLGKDPTLTDRTEVWQDVLSIPINPVLGAGFESFWLGRRREIMWAKWFWHPNQAHNGYLETYLNLGYLGVGILLALIIATFWKCRRELLQNFEFGRLRLSILMVIVVYNWTEAAFKGLSFVWFIFYIIAMDYPQISPTRSEQSAFEPADEREVLV